MIKFTAININNFNRPGMATIIVTLQFLQVITVETCNIYILLSQVNIMSFLWNYVAVSAIFTFDDAYLLPFLSSELGIF